MGNTLQRLRSLPWLTLLQAAALTVFVATVLDCLLIASLRVPAIARSLNLLLAPPAVTFTLLAVFAGIGALAVFFLETFFRHILINAAVLWALIPCLIVALLVKSWLPFPSLIVGIQQASLVALLLGVFFGGMRYWRR